MKTIFSGACGLDISLSYLGRSGPIIKIVLLAVLSLPAKGWQDDFKGTWHLSGSKLCSDGNEITDGYFHTMELLTTNYKYMIADEDESEQQALTIKFTIGGMFPISMEYHLSLNDGKGEDSYPRFLVQPSPFAKEEYGSHNFYIEKTGEDSLKALFVDKMNFCEGDFVVTYMIREKHTTIHYQNETTYP